MWMVSVKALRDFWSSGHARAESPLMDWYKAAKAAEWDSIDDVRKTFPSADGGIKVKSGSLVTVFNIGGNSYRLVAAIHYNTRKVFILRVMSHPEYSKGKWKAQL
jgi:mRNA interferase HigB